MEKKSWQKKLYEMDKASKIKVVIALLIVILIGIVLLKTVNTGCEIREYTLLEQEIKFDSKCKTLSCLFIKTQDVNGVINVEYFDSDTKLLNETFGINVGDKMKMQWCDVEGVGMRVRGISKW